LNAVVADLLRRAEYHLAEAESLAADRYDRLAARESYQAMFHAAQAAVRAGFGASPKTHSGLTARFSDLCRQEPSLGDDLTRSLGRGYAVKDTADYGSVEDAGGLEAGDILEEARGFLRRVRGFLDQRPDNTP
jgi:uncharacterized protein (UPF0332 family)